jgi:purine-nucleoside phosphorylase
MYHAIRQAVQAIQSHSPGFKPKLGIVLGSGLGSIADRFQYSLTLPYSSIPGFFGTSVEGHAGNLVLGQLAGIDCVALKGRFHYYEGYSMSDVVFPTRVICALGIETLLLTNAAGGINTRFRPRDFMILEDHLNLMGDNPLRGPNLAELGPRFPDMTAAYDPRARDVLVEGARTLGLSFHTGVYAAILGPTYETPAEVRMLRTMGADAVGMSTVPECIAAHHLGVRVAGISCITNLAAGMHDVKLTHSDVISNSAFAATTLEKLLIHTASKLVHPDKRV